MRAVIPSYSPDPAPGWCADFIGIPYVLRGRDRFGADCWGLCWIVLEERFGINAPCMDGVVWDTGSKPQERKAAAQAIIHTATEFFDPVEPGAEQPGDIVVLSLAGHPLHMGAVVAPGWMLHSADDADSALERYDGMVWRKRVSGFYRVRHD
jgi:cell wall-associated NlpC family hydrolase